MVGRGDDPEVELAGRLVAGVELARCADGREQIAEPLVERGFRDGTWLAGEDGVDRAGELVQQRRLPRRPCRRARRQAVRLGERAQQLEPERIADERSDILRSDGVAEVAPHRRLGEQQVVAHQRPDVLDVVMREAHPWCDPVDQLHAGVRVIPRLALAEVVQERAHQQQIGSIHGAHEFAGVGHRLQQMAIHGVGVEGVALRQAAHAAPLGQHVAEQVVALQRFDR